MLARIAVACVASYDKSFLVFCTVTMRVLVGLLFCVYVFNTNASTASFIKPCHMSDAACHKASAQKAVPIMAAGLPALGIEQLDPFLIKKVNADQAGLKVEFRDTMVKGLRNCAVVSVNRQSHKHNVELKCSPTVVGDYTLGGQLLVLPIEGNGKYKIKIRDILVRVEYEVTDRVEGGQKYWKLSNWKYTSEVLTSAQFQFQNLFNGNKQLSDPVHQFANQNWKEIFQEVAPPIIKAIVGKIVQQVSNLFDKVPVNELSLD